MRAMGVPAAGALDKLGPVEIEPPAVGAGQVAVRVIAAAVNPADVKVMGGEFAGRLLHGRGKPLVTGYDFSGVVETRGDGVTDLADGAEVFGFLAYASANKQGSFAERIVIDRAAVAAKPPAISHATAAASATPGLTALQALRDNARLKAGGRVLVIGAAGGVGSVGVGVARALGAHVTGICSTYAVDFVRELGADEVVDRRQRDPRSLTGPFDAILDAAAAYSYASTRHMLAPDGAYVATLPSASWLGGKLMTLASKRHCHVVVVQSIAADLELLAGWMAGEAKLRVPIDATFPIRDLAKALDRFAKGELRGRIAIDVDGGW
ncbi:MAG TPA: NAD(P)-dependent alcohol dehydrogenase [Kofleriaceae bacterium]|nr:NAD(P)-dependent alcohol dehydrogenase [Kofleriaceae bacterium]